MSFPSPEPLKIELGEGRSLVFQLPSQQSRDYPTGTMQKGAVLVAGSEALAEEGLGFGVPLLKFGNLDVFPGGAITSFNALSNAPGVVVDYDLNFIKKLTWRGRKIKNPTVYRIEGYFGWVHREFPLLRGVGGRLFGRLRQLFGIKSVFEQGVSVGTVRVVYTVPPPGTTIQIAVELSQVERKGLTEIIISNEQGANYFADYHDSKGSRLSGKGIGTWDEVNAEWASLVDSGNKIMFTVKRLNNARLFRGRELTPGLLAWSGLNYVLPTDTTAFNYEIELGVAR